MPSRTRADVVARCGRAAAQWNALIDGGSPFLRHAFLLALERTGCVGGQTGWSPAHLR